MFEMTGHHHARIVDQDIDAAEVGDCAVDQRLTLVGIRNIGGDGQHPVGSTQTGRELLQFSGGTCCDNQPSACVMKSNGRRPSDACRRTGNDDDFVAEIGHG